MENTENSNPFEGLTTFLETKVSGINFGHLNGDLVLRGSPNTYQDVRAILSKKGIDVTIVRHSQNQTIEEIRISSIDIKGKDFGLRKPKLVVEKKVARVKKPKVEKLVKPKKEKIPKIKKAKPIKVKKAKKRVRVKKTAVAKKKTYKNRKPSLMHKKSDLLDPSKRERYQDLESLEMKVLYKAPLKILSAAIFSKPGYIKSFIFEYKKTIDQERVKITVPRYSTKFSKKEVQVVMKAPIGVLTQVVLSRPDSQIKVLLCKYDRMKSESSRNKIAPPS